MKAAIIKEKNTPIVIEQIANPEPSLKEVVVDVQFAGLNHRDVWILKGQYAGIQYPMVVGSDLAGTYLGKKVIVNPAFNWGNIQTHQSNHFEILGLPKYGALAEKVKVPESSIHPLPEHLKPEEGASLPLAGLTAYRALISRGQAVKGEKVLITGIGGGVALFAMQFALALGLEVYVSSSDENKIQKAFSLGAKAGVNYKNEEWEKDFVKNFGGVDLVIDGAAGDGFGKLVKICNPAARIVIYGGTNGMITQLIPQQIFWKQISILGSTMGSETDFKNMLTMVEKHQIHPVIDQIFPFDEVNEAFNRMSSGKQFGKIVLGIAP
ncbi:MAG: zinc-binding dehydrogenase [Saprospiraceae bacterium]|nr:zinc-binding dehydrogenase [Candidatus Vicinibacter affinis]